MSLDILAYKGLKKVSKKSEIDCECIQTYCEENNLNNFRLNAAFPKAAEDIDEDYIYSAEDCFGDVMGKSCGSYGVWRNELAQLIGHVDQQSAWTHPVDGPFVELINFSDCEGIIGTKVSKKLAMDFSAFELSCLEEKDEDFIHYYNQLKKAFEFASDDGCVWFF
jgi:hypothetical protein